MKFFYPTNYILVDINRTLKRFFEIFKLIDCKINILINIRNPKSLHLSYFTEMYHRILQHNKQSIPSKNILIITIIK